jgi:chemotaxis methyl-accepting protein methylase
MQALGVTTLQDYYRCLTVKPTHQAEVIALLNEITVGETCFFRNQPQLDALRSVVLPHIVEAKLGVPQLKSFQRRLLGAEVEDGVFSTNREGIVKPCQWHD